MPVSKKRKPKRRNTSPIRSSAGSAATGANGSKSGLASKKKLSTQQIIIYVISALVVLSMAIGYLVGNNGPTITPTPTLAPAVDTPAPDTSSTEEAPSTPSPAPTQAQ